MRKIILLGLVCASTQIFAQKSFFGVDAGVNVANQRDHTSFYSSAATSFNKNTVKPSFGVFYQRRFNEIIGLRLNVQYMGLGYDGYPYGQSLSISYLSLPLTLHCSANKHLSFNTGPYLSFTLDGSKVNDQPITKSYHKNDLGFSFGAEYDLYKNFSISMNYIFGMKNIWLQDNTTTTGLTGPSINTKITNRALQLTLIYKFKKTS